MVGEKGELVLVVGVVGLEGVPQEGNLLLLIRPVEGERQVVAQFSGFFHVSCLHRIRLGFAPDAGDSSLNLALEAVD